MMRDEELLMEDVRFSYGGPVPVLDGVNIRTAVGSFLSILGESGGGKSTLLRIIAGIQAADQGVIRVRGETWQDHHREFLDSHLRSIAFVFQEGSLFPHLSVRDNILLAVPRRRIADLAAHFSKAVEITGLGSLLARYPRALSGGQQQRVAIARALYASPALLLMDEPFSNLDRKTAESLRSDLRGWVRDLGISTVLVTHDQGEAMQLSDQVGFLMDGKLAQVGTPEDVYFSPRSRRIAERIGECVYTLWERRDGRFFNADFGFLECAAEDPACQAVSGSAAGKLEIAVRPHDLQICQNAPSSSGGLFKVVDRRFEGHRDLYQVTGPSGLSYALSGAVGQLSPGEACSVRYRPQRMTVIAQAPVNA